MVFSLHDLVELFAGFFRVDGILDRANCTKHLRAKIRIVGEWPLCHPSVVCGLLLRPAHGFNFSAVCVFWWYSENLWRRNVQNPGDRYVASCFGILFYGWQALLVKSCVAAGLLPRSANRFRFSADASCLRDVSSFFSRGVVVLILLLCAARIFSVPVVVSGPFFPGILFF